jgi:hypothetical protein
MTHRPNRRAFLRDAAQLASAAAFLPYATRAESAGSELERFFVFVELKGGVQWSIGVNAPPIDEFLLTRPIGPGFVPVPIDPTGVYGLSLDLARKLQLPVDSLCGKSADKGAPADTLCQEGFYIPVVMDKRPSASEFPPSPDAFRRLINDSYKTVRTKAGGEFHIGPAFRPIWQAGGLSQFFDNVALVRGTTMAGNFHGPCNRAMFSGADQTGAAWHAACVIAKGLERKFGPKLLDNLFLEGPTCNTMADFNVGRVPIALPPLPMTGDALAFLTGEVPTSTRIRSFDSAGLVTKMFQSYNQVSGNDELMRVVRGYLDSMPASRGVANALRGLRTKGLVGLPPKPGRRDLARDLGRQFEIVKDLFQAGLTRVATLCFGARNGENQGDEFGVFDSHVTLYTALQTGYRTFPHHIELAHCMQSINDFITWMNTTRNPASGRPWRDHVTLVVGSEFGRTLNLFAAPPSIVEQGGEKVFMLGSMHLLNKGIGVSNYLLAGAGVRGGAAIGVGDETTAHSDGAISAADVVKTIVGLAGIYGNVDGQTIDFKDLYPNDRAHWDSDIIRAVVA